VDVMELDRSGLVRTSVAALANLFASAGGAELDENLEIHLDPTTAVLAAVLVEKVLAATAGVRTRDVTARELQQQVRESATVVIAGRCICVGSREDSGGCCVCL
jgi:hypothetical protein